MLGLASLAVPSGVRLEAALLREHSSLSVLRTEIFHPHVQRAARRDVAFVQIKELDAAILVALTVASVYATGSTFFPLVLTMAECLDGLMQLCLIVTMGLVQCTSDITQQLILDHVQSGGNICVQIVRRLADGLLHKVLEEGSHLSDVAAANSIEKMVHSRLQSGVDLQ
jgi:hypothetical protein